MYHTFTKEPLHIDDIVIYLKNERTGSSTVRKCKFVGQIVEFTKYKVNIRRFSPADTFVRLDEVQDFGVDTVYSDDVVHIICSKYENDMHIKTLSSLNNIISEQNKDIKLLIGKWFSALEDEGIDPWKQKDCVEMTNKYWYTEDDYKKYLNAIV